MFARLFLLVIAALSPVWVFAAAYFGHAELENVNTPESISLNGGGEIRNSQCGSLEVQGALDFSNLSVKNAINVNGALYGESLKAGSVQIHGAFEAEKIDLRHMTVNGSANLEQAVISGDVKINGSLSAMKLSVSGNTLIHGAIYVEQSTLKKVELSTEWAAFRDSTVDSIEVHEKRSDLEQIFLEGKTEVMGDIKFASGAGEVLIGPEVTLHGKVIGGELRSEADMEREEALEAI